MILRIRLCLARGGGILSYLQNRLGGCCPPKQKCGGGILSGGILIQILIGIGDISESGFQNISYA